MLELPNLQQIFSMSSAVEKVQYVQNSQIDLHGQQLAGQLKEQDEHKKVEVQSFEKIDETAIRDNEQEKKHNRNTKRRKKDDSDADMKTSGEEHHTHTWVKEEKHGEIINIIV